MNEEGRNDQHGDKLKSGLGKDISPQMPQRLQKFQKDASRGGIPIFYTVRTDADGKPFFTQVDYRRREECIVNRKCGICGEDLGNDIVCVGAVERSSHGSQNEFR